MNETVATNIIPHVEKPFFRVVKDVPVGLQTQIQEAVINFIADSHTPEGISHEGFKNQTFQAMASATVLGQGGELWLGTRDGELLVYVLAHVGNDLDGRLSYNISQAWVRKDYRGNPVVKLWWKQIMQRARDCFCGHLVLTSSRNPDAYMRWLGGGLTHYADLLKMTL